MVKDSTTKIQRFRSGDGGECIATGLQDGFRDQVSRNENEPRLDLGRYRPGESAGCEPRGL